MWRLFEQVGWQRYRFGVAITSVFISRSVISLCDCSGMVALSSIAW